MKTNREWMCLIVAFAGVLVSAAAVLMRHDMPQFWQLMMFAVGMGVLAYGIASFVQERNRRIR